MVWVRLVFQQSAEMAQLAATFRSSFSWLEVVEQSSSAPLSSVDDSVTYDRYSFRQVGPSVSTAE